MLTRHDVIVFGASGHARSIADVLKRIGISIGAYAAPDVEDHLDAVCVQDDDTAIEAALERGWMAVVGVGDASIRLGLLDRLRQAKVPTPAIVARSATVSDDASLGPGTVVLEHAHVGPGVSVETGCIINTHAVIEHDCRLGDGVHAAPGSVLAGNVRIGSRTLVGAGATVLPDRSVGDDVTIGAGAVVTASLPGGCIVAGVPATILR